MQRAIETSRSPGKATTFRDMDECFKVFERLILSRILRFYLHRDVNCYVFHRKLKCSRVMKFAKDTLMVLNQPKILVVGATGKFARWVIPELMRRDAVVHALVRNDARAAVARSLGVAEVFIGDLRNTDSLAEATRGMDGVFHIGPAFTPDEAAMGIAIVEAAERNGVKKFAFSSVIQPTNTRLKNHASKIPVEEALYSSRLEYTILQPANFMQNIGIAWPSIILHGRFGEPFPKDIKIARVDYRDVAEVAAIALTEDKLAFATLELAAGMFSRNDVIAAISAELGRPIEAFEPSFSEGCRAPVYLTVSSRCTCSQGSTSTTETTDLGEIAFR